MADSMTGNRLTRMVREAVDLTATERLESERDRDYYDNKQWTEYEKEVLRKRGQPDTVFNHVQRKIDAIVGVEQRTRTDPRAYPRNPEDEKAAHAITDGLRFVVDNNRFDSIRSGVFENQLVEGCGAVEIILEPKRDDLEIKVNRIRWENYIRDPRAREADFSDAQYHGTLKWMDEADALALVPEDQRERITKVIEHGGTPLENHGSYQDRPDYGSWIDRRRRRVQVAQLYYRQPNASWNYALIVGGETVSDEPSFYLNEDGVPSCPIEAVSGYVDRENRRYGVVRAMRGPQDEINQRRSKLLHFMNSRRVIAEKGAVEDVDAARHELARPDGYVERNPQMEFQVIPGGEEAAGHAQLLTHATEEIERLGPSAALSGDNGQSQSGRAIIAQQQAGMTQLSPLFDRLNDWSIRVYRQIWWRMRQSWTGPKWVRVTDDEQAPRFVGLNQPAVDPQTGQIMLDPMTGQPVIENPVPELDMDIVVSTSADLTVLQGEQFEKLMMLAPAMAQAGMPIPPRVLFMASDLRNKEEILQRWDEMGEQQERERVMSKASEMAKRDAEYARDITEAEKTRAETQEITLENEMRRQALLNPASYDPNINI